MTTNVKTTINLCVAGLFVQCGQTPATQSGRNQSHDDLPNILFTLSDDHTAQARGVYGGILSEYAQTSNIRRLAEEGCVLEHCFVPILSLYPAGRLFLQALTVTAIMYIRWTMPYRPKRIILPNK